MNIMEHLDGSLSDFRPRTQVEFVALQLARRFDDTHRLPRYILAARSHTKRALFEAARTARMRYQLNRTPIGDLFFEVLKERDDGGRI